MSTIVSQSRGQLDSMKPGLQSNATTALEQFLSTLFLPDELIEIRFIESWTSHGKKCSRVARTAEWLRPGEFVARYREVVDFAKQERANVYFGVCPRPRRGDSRDDQIQIVRCLWCDMDNVTADEAVAQRETAKVPRPSIVVRSGAGIHGYWLLDRDIRSAKGRTVITALLPQFYRSFGGDHVQNLSRILRPPGTFNYKDARNGRPPQRCELLMCQPQAPYPVAAFSRWMKQGQSEQRTRPVSAQHATQVSAKEFLARSVEAAALVHHNSTSPRGTAAAAISRSCATCFGSGSRRRKYGPWLPAAASSSRTGGRISTSRLPTPKGRCCLGPPRRAVLKQSLDLNGPRSEADWFTHATGLHLVHPDHKTSANSL